MLVALVSVLSFFVLVLVPPVFLALLVRVFPAHRSMPDEDCRPSSRPLIAALRGHGAA